MNSDEIWLLQLWSGVFGAAIGAVAAAAVALLVVSLTNRHQTRLAAEAVAVQKALADKALEKQTEHALAALKAQDESWRQQFSEQQADASAERQRTAIAEMVTCAQELIDRSDEDLEVITAIRRRMTNAWVRFSMEQRLDVEDGSEELLHWPAYLGSLAMDVLLAKRQDKSTDEAFAVLNEVASGFSVLFKHWPRFGPDQRLKISKVLRNVRLNPAAVKTEEAFFGPWTDAQ